MSGSIGSPLRPADVALFARLGIPQDLLEAAQVRRVSHDQARDECGIRYRSERFAGVWFPYLDPESGRRVSGRLRRDHPELDSHGKPVGKYLTPFGDNRYLYFPPGAGQLLADTTISVVFVEAEKSALAFTAAAMRLGRTVLAVATGGCYGWTGRIGKAEDANGVRVDVKGPLPDIERIAMTGRNVVIAFDANAATNTKVQAARRALAQHCSDQGACVRLAELPTEPDVNGPDDYRAKYGDAALFAVIDAAKPVRRSQNQPIADLLHEFHLTAEAVRDITPDVLDARLRALAGVLRGADRLRRALVADTLKNTAKVPRSIVTAALNIGDNEPGEAAAAPARSSVSATPRTLAQVHETFWRWFGDEYDLDALDAVLATAAAERLEGDPLWLLMISGSGNAKTETVQALAGAGGLVTSTISSEGALLSGTARRERTKDATGGLLRRIGSRGLLVVKDVTSILSMNRDTRASLLAALREIHDGKWERNVGTDGGRSLAWAGRIVVIGAVTTAWDRAHDVIASMGDRFVVVRTDSTIGRMSAGRRACRNTGDEERMRAELAAVVAGVLTTVDASNALTLSDDEQERLLTAANVVTLARTGVEYDYRGDVIDAHAPEMPTRFTKQLTQLVRGATTLGIDRGAALRLAIRCARDSMPPLRLAILDDLARHPNSQTRDVRRRLEKPRATVDRQLQALQMLGVLACQEDEGTHRGEAVTRWLYRLKATITPDVLNPDSDSVPEKSPHTGTGTKEEGQGKEETKTVIDGDDVSGTEKPPPPIDVPASVTADAADDRDVPLDDRRGESTPTNRWQGRLPADGEPPMGISREAWARQHGRRGAAESVSKPDTDGAGIAQRPAHQTATDELDVRPAICRRAEV